MKTIKRERQVRFDELIKHVWDKRIVGMNFKSKNGVNIYFHTDGDVDVDEVRYIGRNDLFTITEEVEIDYDTRLDLIAVRKAGIVSRFENRSIQGVLAHFNIRIEVEVDYIYIQNEDGSIGEMVWSKERGLID
ncbi:hypothetical protein MRN59_05740 [Macrococcoides caseolyticum]|uniref:hypothetical protein n=1 Tax=Macrococcoides caseolyticum TaxID=69966 RepID=UPI00339D9A01